MVNTSIPSKEHVWQLLNQIPDPDIPVLSIVELGIVRAVDIADHTKAIVTITPSYSGCPAMNLFKEEIKSVLFDNGFTETKINISLSPAWTTDWISSEAREKMRVHGIAPPEKEPEADLLFSKQKQVTCPRCSHKETRIISRFGSTPCKALWYCNSCEQPFEYFKCF